MRYPGKTHQEIVAQRAITIIALILFVGSFYFATTKQPRTIKAARLIPRPSTEPTSKTNTIPNSEATVTLVLYDALSQKKLTNQSVAFIITDDCQSNETCPSSPLALTTDDSGSLRVPLTVARHIPKIYATGYQLDRYYTIPDNQHLDEVIVDNPLPGTKTEYDMSKEPVPLGLSPVKP